jgi:hypothetical protein
MVTPQEMRSFAQDCERWSAETYNASQRDLMVRIAKTWMATAATLDRRSRTHGDVPPDLRRKLD